MKNVLEYLSKEALTLVKKSEIHQIIYKNLLPLVESTEKIIKQKKMKDMKWVTIALSIVTEVESRERDILMKDINDAVSGDSDNIEKAFIKTLKPKCIAIQLMYEALVTALKTKEGTSSCSSATGGSSSSEGIPGQSLRAIYAFSDISPGNTNIFGLGDENEPQFGESGTSSNSPFASFGSGFNFNHETVLSGHGIPPHHNKKRQNSKFMANHNEDFLTEAKRLQLMIFTDMFSNQLDLGRITALEELNNNSLEHLKKINNLQKKLRRIGDDDVLGKDYEPILELWQIFTRQILGLTATHSLANI